jgi:O-methyltransferase
VSANDELENLAARLRESGYVVRKGVFPPPAFPERALYQPYVNRWAVFSPWLADPLIEGVLRDLAAGGADTLVTRDRLWILAGALRQTGALAGEVWELGVYQGGSALLLRRLLEQEAGGATLRLFDTFSGMPEVDGARDKHKAGDFADTSLQAVRRVVGAPPWIDYREGCVPETFAGLDSSAIRFAHLDLDLHGSTRAACEFVYPRLAAGGIIVFDDYGFWTCPGARAAVDEFFADKREIPLALPTGQALVSKLP